MNNLVYNGLPGHRKEEICLKEGSSRGTVHGNRVYSVRGVGIYVDAWDKHTSDIEIVGNVVWGNGTEEWGGGVLADNLQLRSATIRASISSGNLSFEIAVGASPERSVVIDRNLSDGQQEDPAGRLGQHPLAGNPRFVDPETGDFRRSPRLPALGLGAHEG